MYFCSITGCCMKRGSAPLRKMLGRNARPFNPVNCTVSVFCGENEINEALDNIDVAVISWFYYKRNWY